MPDSAEATTLERGPLAAAPGGDRRAGSSRRTDDRLALALLAVLPSGALVLSARDEVLLANPAAVEMLVVRREEVVLPELLELAAACRRSGCPQERVVTLPHRLEPPLRRPRPDREAPAARVRAVPLPELDAVALLLDDVTEQRRVDAVRRDFVANVSHELKTPVGGLHLLAEAIEASPDDTATVHRFATRMVTESERLANLVQELIDLSRLQGAEPMQRREDIAVSDIVADALDRTRVRAEAKDIGVSVRGDPALLLTGDARQLVTAVANLVTNAVAYSPAGTRVVVGLAERGGWVEISVADEGIGIAEKDRERVFERFFRVDQARSRLTGGTGLGLSIVKHIATNHGGEVTVWSREGAGSTFTLRLPSPDPVRPLTAGAT